MIVREDNQLEHGALVEGHEVEAFLTDYMPGGEDAVWEKMRGSLEIHVHPT